jgi:hypothetical protein
MYVILKTCIFGLKKNNYKDLIIDNKDRVTLNILRRMLQFTIITFFHFEIFVILLNLISVTDFLSIFLSTVTERVWYAFKLKLRQHHFWNKTNQIVPYFPRNSTEPIRFQ